jgi:hypothetical protein
MTTSHLKTEVEPTAETLLRDQILRQVLFCLFLAYLLYWSEFLATEHTDTVCGQNAEFWYVKADGIYSYH